MADIIETAVKAGTFTTLVKAVEATELVDILKVLVLTLCLHPLMKHLPSSQREL
jgi:hypothetical protein